MALEDYKDILHRCFRCGYCKFPSEYSDINCPSYKKFKMETYSPGGRLWLIRAVANGDINLSDNYSEILYSCTMCGNCTEHCCLDFKNDILNIMIAARTEVVEKSILPSNVQKYFENIFVFGNPWKKLKKKRSDWANGTEIHRYGNDDEYLYYVGDVGSYHPRGCDVSSALGEILLQSNVSFGVLGAEEISDGNDVRDMGEEGLFDYLMEKNVSIFMRKGVKKIITYSPHAYNVMKNHYRKLPESIEVFHYLDIVYNVLIEGKLEMSSTPKIKVTYHDSCFLGRWNQKYDTPRDVLKLIPMVKLVEMERNKENAFCCGGGNGNYYTDILGGGRDSPARIRVREAIATGAEVLAVSCPVCLIMFEDAIVSENVGDQIEVLDIAEIINNALLGTGSV